jgi:hypothetical protein
MCSKCTAMAETCTVHLCLPCWCLYCHKTNYNAFTRESINNLEVRIPDVSTEAPSYAPCTLYEPASSFARSSNTFLSRPNSSKCDSICRAYLYSGLEPRIIGNRILWATAVRKLALHVPHFLPRQKADTFISSVTTCLSQETSSSLL